MVQDLPYSTTSRDRIAKILRGASPSIGDVGTAALRAWGGGGRQGTGFGPQIDKIQSDNLQKATADYELMQAEIDRKAQQGDRRVKAVVDGVKLSGHDFPTVAEFLDSRDDLKEADAPTIAMEIGKKFGAPTKTGDPFTLSEGAVRYDASGTEIASNPKPVKEPERKTIKGADGYNYYADTGERVLPGVKKPASESQNAESSQIQTFTDPKGGVYTGRFKARSSGGDAGSIEIRMGGKWVPLDEAEQAVGGPLTRQTAGSVSRNPMSGEQFMKLTETAVQDRQSIERLTNYWKNVLNTAQGWEVIADQFMAATKTMFGGKIDPQEVATLVSTGQLQALMGRFRKEVVGGGVMTEQDALRVITALGGDVDMWRNKQVVSELIQQIMKEKVEHYNSVVLPIYNSQVTVPGREGFKKLDPIKVDPKLFELRSVTKFNGMSVEELRAIADDDAQLDALSADELDALSAILKEKGL